MSPLIPTKPYQDKTLQVGVCSHFTRESEDGGASCCAPHSWTEPLAALLNSESQHPLVPLNKYKRSRRAEVTAGAVSLACLLGQLPFLRTHSQQLEPLEWLVPYETLAELGSLVSWSCAAPGNLLERGSHLSSSPPPAGSCAWGPCGQWPCVLVTLLSAPREPQGAEKVPAGGIVSQTCFSGLAHRMPHSPPPPPHTQPEWWEASGLQMGPANEGQWV